MGKLPELQDILGELGAGVFVGQLEEVLKDTARATINHGDKGKVGKVTITLKMTRLGEDSDMVDLEHSWAYEQPEMRGKSTRVNTSNTPMCVSSKGHLTVYPLTQEDLFNETNLTSIKGGK
jgi:hypothetical protein